MKIPIFPLPLGLLMEEKILFVNLSILFLMMTSWGEDLPLPIINARQIARLHGLSKVLVGKLDHLFA